MEIQPIRIPRNVIENVAPPVTRGVPPPVVSGLEVPVMDVPTPIIEYPVIDVPTEQDFQEQLQQPQESEPEEPAPTRELPPPKVPSNVVDVAGVSVTLPPMDVVATAGATAVVATTASLAAGVVVKQAVNALEPFLKNLAKRKFKVKIKKVKPVLHFVLSDNGNIDVIQYSMDGMKVVDSTSMVETYLRDKLDENSLYEIDNKIIIDEVIKDKFTKEGRSRFKKLFMPPSKMAKKLAARFSF